MYGWATAGITATILGLLLWNAERRIDNLHEDNAQLKVNALTAIEANKTTNASLAECKAVNEFNATQRESAELRAGQAEDRVANLETELHEALTKPITVVDTSCRSLREPLPADFLSQLCVAGVSDDTATNCRAN